jgi:IclR family pca regulon transcriptional regulator
MPNPRCTCDRSRRRRRSRSLSTDRDAISLSNLCGLAELDLGATQRFTFTLVALGHLKKHPQTRRPSCSPIFSNSASLPRIQRRRQPRRPVFQQPGQMKEEVCNLTCLTKSTSSCAANHQPKRSRPGHHRLLAPASVMHGTGPVHDVHPLRREVGAVLDASDLVQHTRRHSRAAAHSRGGSRRPGSTASCAPKTSTPWVAFRPARQSSMRKIVSLVAVNFAMPRARWNTAYDAQRSSDLVRRTALAISAHHKQPWHPCGTTLVDGPKRGINEPG